MHANSSQFKGLPKLLCRIGFWSCSEAWQESGPSCLPQWKMEEIFAYELSILPFPIKISYNASAFLESVLFFFSHVILSTLVSMKKWKLMLLLSKMISVEKLLCDRSEDQVDCQLHLFLWDYGIQLGLSS
jgi:hypothetical protein